MADRDAALELNPAPFVRTLTTTPPMKPNVGGFDRILRVILGLGILGVGYYYHTWWGLVGLVPLLTAIVRFCPAYLPFGLSTCPRKDSTG